jgi:hypothetical protein
VRISADARERLREMMQSDEEHIHLTDDKEWQDAVSDSPEPGK